MKKPFYCYWFASASISLADVIYIMVITTFIYQQTGSAFFAALFPLLRALASLAAGFTAPLILEQFSFSKLLVFIPFIKASLITCLIVGFPFITSNMTLLLFCVLIISFIEGWGSPLLSTVVPKVVEKENLVKANSSLSVTNQAVQIAGYTFTGLLVIKFGHMPTLIGAAILLWLAAVCLSFIAGSIKLENNQHKTTQSKWMMIKEGWSHLWNNETLRLVTIMDMIEGMAGTIWVGAITLVYVKEALHQDVQWWGYINSSYYIGTILGGILTYWMAKQIQKHLIINMAIGSALFSLFTLLYGLNSVPILSLFLCVLMGPAYQLRDVSQQTAIQTNVDSDLLPKIYASRNIVLSTITSISIAIFGWVADVIGVRWVYVFGACLIGASALLSFTLINVQRKQGKSKETITL